MTPINTLRAAFATSLAAFTLAGVLGAFGQATTPANPTSTMTLTAVSTARGANTLVANSATAGSVVVSSFPISAQYRSAMQPGLRLSVNDPTSTGWGGVSVQVDEWSAAPTFTNGDRGAFAVATGSASHLGSFTCTFAAVAGDGAYAECSPLVGNVRIPAGIGTVYWTVEATSATGVTSASATTMTLTAEVLE